MAKKQRVSFELDPFSVPEGPHQREVEALCSSWCHVEPVWYTLYAGSRSEAAARGRELLYANSPAFSRVSVVTDMGVRYKSPLWAYVRVQAAMRSYAITGTVNLQRIAGSDTVVRLIDSCARVAEELWQWAVLTEGRSCEELGSLGSPPAVRGATPFDVAGICTYRERITFTVQMAQVNGHLNYLDCEELCSFARCHANPRVKRTLACLMNVTQMLQHVRSCSVGTYFNARYAVCPQMGHVLCSTHDAVARYGGRRPFVYWTMDQRADTCVVVDVSRDTSRAIVALYVGLVELATFDLDVTQLSMSVSYNERGFYVSYGQTTIVVARALHAAPRFAFSAPDTVALADINVRVRLDPLNPTAAELLNADRGPNTSAFAGVHTCRETSRVFIDYNETVGKLYGDRTYVSAAKQTCWPAADADGAVTGVHYLYALSLQYVPAHLPVADENAGAEELSLTCIGTVDVDLSWFAVRKHMYTTVYYGMCASRVREEMGNVATVMTEEGPFYLPEHVAHDVFGPQSCVTEQVITLNGEDVRLLDEIVHVLAEAVSVNRADRGSESRGVIAALNRCQDSLKEVAFGLETTHGRYDVCTKTSDASAALSSEVVLAWLGRMVRSANALEALVPLEQGYAVTVVSQCYTFVPNAHDNDEMYAVNEWVAVRLRDAKVVYLPNRCPASVCVPPCDAPAAHPGKYVFYPVDPLRTVYVSDSLTGPRVDTRVAVGPRSKTAYLLTARRIEGKDGHSCGYLYGVYALDRTDTEFTYLLWNMSIDALEARIKVRDAQMHVSCAKETTLDQEAQSLLVSEFKDAYRYRYADIGLPVPWVQREDDVFLAGWSVHRVKCV